MPSNKQSAPLTPLAAPGEHARPSPEDFSDYAGYLRAMVEHLKATRRGFSYRQFSKRAGYSSPNFLKLVADGKRRLTQDSAARFARALDLSAAERDAFEVLVQLTHATSDDERNRYFQRLHKSGTSGSATKRLEVAQYEVYTRWYALAIREMLQWPDFKEDPKWIAEQLRPRIKAADAREALRLLEELGLVARDDSGRLRSVDIKISTPPTAGLAVRNFHRALLEHARLALERWPTQRRNVTSLTVSMAPEKYAQVCERIAAFRAELLAFIESEPPTPQHDVYQLGFAVFPVTHR